MRFFLLLTLCFLAACAPARLDRTGFANSAVISGFLPDKSEGAGYKIGEQVRFSFQLARAGFVTLLSYGATGNTTPLESNVQLGLGKHTFPRADDRQGNAQAAYVVGAPTGQNRVVLIFTNVALKTVPRGRLDNAQLETAIKLAIEGSNAQIIDLSETNIEVTP